MAILGALAPILVPGGAAAHPLGNFTVNRAVVIEVGERVAIRYLIDMAEIPAFEAIRELDTDNDGMSDASESDAFAGATCSDAQAALEVAIDAAPAATSESFPPMISFPAGAGGLATLRLECSFVVEARVDESASHMLEVRDTTDDGRLGWREVTARALGAASVSGSDVPETSDSDELRSYPEDALQTPPDIRTASLTFRVAEGATPSAPAARTAPEGRASAADPLAALAGGELSPTIVALALVVALGLGAAHAISPGHGKTLVAAYVLGAGGDARSAMQIGLSVAASHTAGVFVLGLLTLAASELFLPERVIGWLSLISGIVVAALGLVLLGRQLPRIRQLARGRVAAAPHAHDHGHGHVDGHEHDDGHGHVHEVPTGRLTWRSALALGFAGGAVPSASAVIVLLVAISSDRLAFGILLIAMFGLGMAVVLGGLGLVIARISTAASGARRGWLTSTWARRIGALIPVAAGVVVFVTGVVFAFTALGQLS